MCTFRLTTPETGDYQLLCNSRLFFNWNRAATDAVFAKETRLSCNVWQNLARGLPLSFVFTSSKTTLLIRQVNHCRLDLVLIWVVR